ncbi:MAG: hypothetical protein M1405_01290 [Patescibacteria group bacterium]|nr:hypothetical protein [Patescibacteria group bacterium]
MNAIERRHGIVSPARRREVWFAAQRRTRDVDLTAEALSPSPSVTQVPDPPAEDLGMNSI